MAWVTIEGTGLGDIGDRYNDISLAAGKMWAVSREGSLVRFTGTTVASTTSLGRHLRSVAVEPGGDVGWVGILCDVAAPTPQLKKTTDGGASWHDVENLPAAPAHGICGLRALSPTLAFACGTYDPTTSRGAWRTTDGVRWDAMTIPAEIVRLTDLHFWNAEHGLVVGGAQFDGAAAVRPSIHYTKNGGKTWHAAHVEGDLPAGSYCWKVSFLDDCVGHASVANSGTTGYVLKTTDGGACWEVSPLNLPAPNGTWDLQGIGFLSAKRGWVGQFASSAYETIDGGKSWLPAAPLSDLNRVRCAPDGSIFACGDAVYYLAPTKAKSAGDSPGATTVNHPSATPISLKA